MINDGLRIDDASRMTFQRALADGLSLRGRVKVEVFGPDGALKQTQIVDNLVVTTGKNHSADQLSAAPGQAAMSHMAVGTGTTAPAAGDTALVTESDRNALTSRTDSTNVMTYVGDWAAGDATANLREAGIFNAATVGTMLARALITVDKGAGDTLKITWTVTLG